MSKCVFIVFVTAEVMLQKVNQICHAFNCAIYECPRMTADEMSEMIVQKGLVPADLEEDAKVVKNTGPQPPRSLIIAHYWVQSTRIKRTTGK